MSSSPTTTDPAPATAEEEGLGDIEWAPDPTETTIPSSSFPDSAVVNGNETSKQNVNEETTGDASKPVTFSSSTTTITATPKQEEWKASSSPPEKPQEKGNSNDDDDDPNTPTLKLQFLTGMSQDLRARVPLYWDDWKRPQSMIRVINATFFAFVVQLIPALIFAELLDKQTQGSLAVAEVLLSAGIIGIIYAIISGQPLVLLGITGPVAILLGTSYGLAEQFNANYWSFFWWLNIWTAILHLFTAMVGLVNFVWQITPFSSQIFEFFIASSFIYESIRDLVEPIEFKTDVDGNVDAQERSTAYASLVIGILTFYICWTLHFAETWVYFTREVRTILTSYNMMIALIIMTALSYLPGVDQSDEDGHHHGIVRVHIRSTPWDWQPTSDRPWLTSPLEGIDAKGIFGALFPAFMLYLLFFIDHNISSILTQSPKYNLTKPPAYHWDFFCLGVTIVPCGLLGLPPGSGLIPQAPLHTRALCTRKHETIHGVPREVVTHCEEQRWSALFQASFMFVALSLIKVISWIPVGCLFGIFLYLGVGAMHGNEIWERITLMFMLPKKRPRIPIVTKVSSWRTVQYFTAIQVICAMSIFGIAQFASVGYIFPALVAALVPIRSMLISRMFTETDLLYLDPANETEDDYVAEQSELHKAERRPSIDASELDHGISRFRTKDVPHDAKEYYVQHPDVLLRQRHVGSQYLMDNIIDECHA